MSVDQTFRAFTPAQAEAYAKHRGGSYPQPLYDAILSYHTGPKRTLFDVGTGPGKAVFDLLPHFERAYGCDTSPEMISRAQTDAESLSLSNLTSFAVCGGEDCDRAIPASEHGKLDVITVAMTAHWLHMPDFYAAAAKLLRPGGTLAIWTCSNMYVHPSEPNAKRIQEILFELQRGMLAPYSTPGNVLSDLAYTTLPLPWTLDKPSSAFKESNFARKDWDLDGVPSAPDLPDGTPGPFVETSETDLESLKNGLGSASQVVRWRDANPDKAFTDEDCVYLTIRKLKEAMGERTDLVTASSCSLLLMRRE